MDRITINLTPELGAELRQRAAAEQRSLSSHIKIVIERHLAARGLLPVEPEIAQALVELRAVGLDPLATLRAAISGSAPR